MISYKFIIEDSFLLSYKEILNEFKNKNLNEYNSICVCTILKEPFNYKLPPKLHNELNKYYREFVNLDICNRWSIKRDWYLSFARRLTLERESKFLFQECIKSLVENKDTRRALIHTFDINVDGKNYMPSLSSVQFNIKNNYLNMVTFWRSREFFTAYIMNIIAMLSLLKNMYTELLKYYKNLRLGTYTELVIELHNYPMTKDQLNIITKSNFILDSIFNIFSLEKIKFMWGVVDNEREYSFDRNY